LISIRGYIEHVEIEDIDSLYNKVPFEGSTSINENGYIGLRRVDPIEYFLRSTLKKLEWMLKGAKFKHRCRVRVYVVKVV
jgi:hypothetical protein